jgi:hypothetical protein
MCQLRVSGYLFLFMPQSPLPEAQAQHPGCADDFARRMRRSWARLIKKV